MVGGRLLAGATARRPGSPLVTLAESPCQNGLIQRRILTRMREVNSMRYALSHEDWNRTVEQAE
jgi:hypothetical protein